jgi:hypothetical protein
MKATFAVLATLTVIACRASSDGQLPPGSAETGSAVGRQPAWGDLDGHVGGCGTDTLPVHADPRGLVDEYLLRDTAWTLSKDGWDNGIGMCVDRITGDDRVAVVARFRVIESVLAKDSARFTIVYDRLGTFDWVGNHRQLTADTRPDTNRMVLIRTRRGWRISDLDATARVSPSAARKLPGADDSIPRRQLDSLGRRCLAELRGASLRALIEHARR